MNINEYISKKSSKNSMQNMIEKYSSMSEEDLMREMFKSAEEGRRNGTFNDQMLDDFYSRVTAFLSPEQRERMKELMIELKK